MNMTTTRCRYFDCFKGEQYPYLLRRLLAQLSFSLFLLLELLMSSPHHVRIC